MTRNMTQIMGILNVTPDSFSDGGKYLDAKAAIQQGERLAEQGADIVDVGGESTRPGARRVDAETEAARVVPVVRILAGSGLVVSVDTMRASTALAAIEAGASIVNDVSGGLADEAMAAVVADSGCYWVLMHWRGHSATMQSAAQYTNVVGEVADELHTRVSAAVDAGVERQQIILDPGLGFAKLPEHNWALLRSLEQLSELGFPLLIGASRKSFLDALRPDTRSAHERDAASLAVSLHCERHGAWGVRVHDVRGTADAFATAKRLRGETG